jgi:hypothetical protein
MISTVPDRATYQAAPEAMLDNEWTQLLTRN